MFFGSGGRNESNSHELARIMNSTYTMSRSRNQTFFRSRGRNESNRNELARIGKKKIFHELNLHHV